MNASLPHPRLVLASASPRRREMLARIGFELELHPVDVDERARAGESGVELARRLALAKARRAAAERPDLALPLLAADTVVVSPCGALLGKPADVEEARQLLRLLSGSWHEVVSAIALVFEGREACRHAATRVRFAALEEREIAAYVAGDEPWDKAGGYALQGAAGWFVEEIEGSVSNVIGLPTGELRALWRELGLPTPSLGGR